MALTLNNRTTVGVDLTTYFTDKTGSMTFVLLPNGNPYNNAYINGNMLYVTGDFRGTTYSLGVRATNSYGLTGDGYIPVTEAGVKHCVVSDYPDWNTISCEPNGTKTRRRTILVEPAYGGNPCPNDMSQTINCAFDCVVNPSQPWQAKTACSTSGWDRGTTYEHPNIIYHPKNGGRACPATRTYTCPVNCTWTWGPCSNTCGSGKQKAQVTQYAINGGSCYLPEQDCYSTDGCCRGNWGGWSGCSPGCGNGTQYRDFVRNSSSALVHPVSVNCPARQSQGCYLGACPPPPPPPPPNPFSGSYIHSCIYCASGGGALGCICRRIDGKWQYTHAYCAPRNVFWNNNGSLVCG